jgi:methanogenic corrinoid protein MtbC1
MESGEIIKGKLHAMKSWLPAEVLAGHFALRPDMAASYTEHQKKNFMNDVAWILAFLGESAWADQPVLFEEFSAWLRTFLTSVRVPMKDVAESFDLIDREIGKALEPEEAVFVSRILAKGRERLTDSSGTLSLPASENLLQPLASEYLSLLLRGNKNAAFELIMREVNGGMKVRNVYLDVFQPVQYEIGRLWQTARITVAQEHFCTAATQLVMSQLYPYLFTGEKKDKKMITTCESGELHEIGARMVTDFFEMEGWDTYYLGANMPVESLIRFISDIKPGFIAISATMTFHLSSVEEIIRRIRSTAEIPSGTRIMVGGFPFKIATGLWKQIGADYFAASAEEAVSIAERLIAE